LARIFGNLPNLTFFTNFQNYSIVDALFCGAKLINTENKYFGNILDPNSFIVNIQRQLVNFMQKLLPSYTSNGKTMCENIIVDDFGDCSNSFLSLMYLKSIMQGYILVTPDTPLVRSIIDDLNNPLRYTNLLRDLLVDIDRVSMDMQDEIGRSRLPTFINVSYKKFDFYIQLFREFLNSCTILN
jgi:hypothetical protein